MSQDCNEKVMDITGNADQFWQAAIQKAWDDEDFSKDLKVDPNGTLMEMADESPWNGSRAIKTSINRYAATDVAKSLEAIKKPQHGQYDGFERKNVPGSVPDQCTYLYPPTCC